MMRTEEEIRDRLRQGCCHFACQNPGQEKCIELRMLQWVLGEVPLIPPIGDRRAWEMHKLLSVKDA